MLRFLGKCLGFLGGLICCTGLALKPFSAVNENPFDQLSERELQIALMIMDCKKVAEISEQLFLSPKTVNSYRYRLFEKLSINSDVELALLAVRHGLIDTEAII